MKDLQYPFDSAAILKKKRSIKRTLLDLQERRLEKRIAILGGSTTNEVKNILELFLLDYGIAPTFYESEFGKYWEDAMFGEALADFCPDVIYIHTTARNVSSFPSIRDDTATVEEKLRLEAERFTTMWDKLREAHKCMIIQNNFERQYFRLMGNSDISDFRGRSSFLQQLNQKFYAYAADKEDFYINDIEFLSASYGLEKWSDPAFWYLYKYALCVPAIPELAFNLANIIKSAYGKNKKALVLDLDNTLWGGVVGDDGVDGIEQSPDLPTGQVYREFQEYLRLHKDLGVLLTICSKNEKENAFAGLRHPDCLLKPEDFAAIKASWRNKDDGIREIAEELSLGVDSFVFVDDNPAERALVQSQIPEMAVPEIGSAAERYIQILDRSGFFEVTSLSADDIKRNEMYEANQERAAFGRRFETYADYLMSLEMTAKITNFQTQDIPRIAQLINKSNQFNLTTKRYSQSEIQAIAGDDTFICLCGRLKDRFGDNGIVSVVIGKQIEDILDIELWLMSCRVLKRDMEYAMFKRLAEICRQRGIKTLKGSYYPTAKNKMVSDFYSTLGFEKTGEIEAGDSYWKFALSSYNERMLPMILED